MNSRFRFLPGILLLLTAAQTLRADPQLTSWFTANSGKYARIYADTTSRTNGVSTPTWTGQTSPVYSGVNEINSSSSWVYVRNSGMAGFVMGPWSNPNLPKNQAGVWRFPRTPNTSSPGTSLTGVGAIGLLVDGVAIYNTSDGFSYSVANAKDATPNGGIGAGDGIWNRDAFPNELVSFDYALAHNPPSGEYHSHVNPIATRYVLNDNVTYDTSTKNYAENTATTNFAHSPIIGWLKDGLPLYGPYGYDGGSTGATATASISGGTVTAVNITAGGTLYQSAPLVAFSGGGGSSAVATAVLSGGVVTSVIITNGGTGYTSAPTVKIGGVRRIISGYQLRDGTNGSTNLASTGRTTLPVWAAAAQARPATLAAGQYGPATTYTSASPTLTYTPGHFSEDYAYVGDPADFGGATYIPGSRTNAGGVFYDLNKYNARFCVTPEFPNGTWAYFTTITSTGTSFYPYNVGRWYHGSPTGGTTTAAVMNADTPLAQQFIGGANKALTIGTPGVSGTNVTLTWSATEGGTYTVEASQNQSSWTTKTSGLVAATDSASSSYTALGTSGTEYGRLSRTALATYDSTGQTAATVSQSATTSYTPGGGSTAPTISNIATAPANPNSVDAGVVTANIAAPSGRTISSAQLTYNTGSTASVVFYETMGAAATTQWDGTGTVYPWTRVFTGTSTAFRQSTAGNHTAVGGGNQFGFETIGCSPTIANNTITTTNNINATGTSGTVEFYVSTAGMTGAQGWDFQTSTDGTTWTTRVSDLNIATSYGFTQKTYTLSAAERVITLKLRFRFAGGGMNMTPSLRLDDIKVTIGGTSSPVNVTMFDDGAHGDGAAGDGVYGASIPAQTTGTTVNYTIAATDSTGASTTSASNSYTTITGAAAMSVTPSTGLTSSGYVGGAFSPASASCTIMNSGTASMNWTASKLQSWLTLSATGGALAVGASTTVTATINAGANSLPVGSYSDTVTFTNSTNGSGNTTRAVSLTVNTNTPPSAPSLTTLATFPQGKSKTISWSAVSGATTYTLQVSATATFSSVLSSQTVTTTSAGFTNLTEGVTYYYRLLATNAIGSSGYSNIVSSTQDNTAPTVAITSPASGTSTATASIVVSGTASDATSAISKVTVNGATATTSNNFASWSATVPLGFGTNGITAVAYDGAGNVTTTAPVRVTLTTAQTYNPLIIPELMTGTTFNLNLHTTTKQFFSGVATNTDAYNNMLFWGPTLIMKKGDFVQMNVTNNLLDTTTTHWHGLHIPAIMDGGPRETIPAGTTWSPSFYVKNNAGTYWYHPHLHTTTQEQVTMGGGGLIIIQDDQEAALPLPRTYGVDDIPLVLTSRRFTGAGAGANQFALNGAFGDFMLVNGTLNPQVNLPAQVVRLRILDGEIARNHNLGFSDNRTFYVIATDGGLLNAPVPVTRMVMGSAERYEILVDLRGMTPGTTLDLMTYNSNQAAGYSGGQVDTTGANGSLLNNLDFVDLHINIVAATNNPVTSIPTTLANNVYWTSADVTNNRTVSLTGVGGAPLSFDNLVYSPSVINQTLNLNAVEQWTLSNVSNLAHTFHIHDIQFYLTSMPGGIPAYMQGWKDSFIIPQQSSVSFIAKFDDFASNTNPFMFHCHFLQHEDGGLMGQFLVRNNTVEDLAIASFTRTGSTTDIALDFKATPGTTYTVQYSPDTTTGSWIDVGSITSDGSSAHFSETDPTRLTRARGFYRVAMPVISP